jgi:hypothetical protein
VLAFRCGSVPEIVEDGLTGRIVSDVGEAVRGLPGLLKLDRKAILNDYRNIGEELGSLHRRTGSHDLVLSPAQRSLQRGASGRVGVDGKLRRSRGSATDSFDSVPKDEGTRFRDARVKLDRPPTV